MAKIPFRQFNELFVGHADHLHASYTDIPFSNTALTTDMPIFWFPESELGLALAELEYFEDRLAAITETHIISKCPGLASIQDGCTTCHDKLGEYRFGNKTVLLGIKLSEDPLLKHEFVETGFDPEEIEQLTLLLASKPINL